jgi:hypothetical protein
MADNEIEASFFLLCTVNVISRSVGNFVQIFNTVYAEIWVLEIWVLEIWVLEIWVPVQAYYRPCGFQEVEASFLDSQHMKVVMLSALRTGRMVLIFVRV